jgi:hypothetical protein
MSNMYKIKFTFLCLLAFSFQPAFSQTQELHVNKCEYFKIILGKWILVNVVADLSGENLETEGQSWKIAKDTINPFEGKITLQFSPDGTFIGKNTLNNPKDTLNYGYWDASEDCKQLHLTVDGNTDELKLFSIEKGILVLELKDHYKLIFRKMKW